MGGFIAFELGSEVGFDHSPGMGAVLRVGKLDPDPGFAVAHRTLWGDPDHFTGNRQTLLEFHYGQQKEYFDAKHKVDIARKWAELIENRIAEAKMAKPWFIQEPSLPLTELKPHSVIPGYIRVTFILTSVSLSPPDYKHRPQLLS